MTPDNSFPFAKAKKSDSLMKLPAFLFLGFLYTSNVVIGFDILAANMKNVSLGKCMMNAINFIDETKQMIDEDEP